MAGRSPVKSAILSAFVPGLGKFYIGKYRLGFNMLFMNGLFMAQTYESVHQLGWTHPLSLFNLLLASLFYASNIYGSYRDTRYFQQETLQQLYFDAANYYSTTHFPSLYR
jgi:TM2 domain-containing membrane protein YozV